MCSHTLYLEVCCLQGYVCNPLTFRLLSLFPPPCLLCLVHTVLPLKFLVRWIFEAITSHLLQSIPTASLLHSTHLTPGYRGRNAIICREDAQRVRSSFHVFCRIKTKPFSTDPFLSCLCKRRSKKPLLVWSWCCSLCLWTNLTVLHQGFLAHLIRLSQIQI